MAVKIRLSRTGMKNQPSYRVVAIDEHKKRDGKNIEILGVYNPLLPKDNFKVKVDRFKYWLSVGAKPSKTVAKFFAKIK